MSEGNHYPEGFLGAHVMRHSGLSNDVAHKRRTLEEGAKRGSWDSKKSVKRYEKHALLTRSWSHVPAQQQAAVTRKAATLPRLLKTEVARYLAENPS